MDYQAQGNDFLKKHNITFKAKFLKNDYHFQEDKDTRDIFRITFSRKFPSLIPAKFSINFGQSIKESTGCGDNKPTAYDVLACIQKYDVGSFENFCGDFGYNGDSRHAEKIYKGVLKEWEKVSYFFSESEISELQEIQ